MSRTIEKYRECAECGDEVPVVLDFDGNKYEMNYYGARLLFSDGCVHPALAAWLDTDEGEKWGRDKCDDWLSDALWAGHI